QVIPGIYAAGEIIGGTHGNNRLGSNAVAAAVTHGFMIGYYTATGNPAPFLR
ncbi:MAG: FAD-binding protein, partial [Treponema sp.]|nr:FAD-binding protein [Treponema sp.]